MYPVEIDQKAFQTDTTNHVSLISDIIKFEYNTVNPLIQKLFQDVINLYQGLWPTHEACLVKYHTLDHALDVTLLTARIAAGWNRQKDTTPFSEDVFLHGLAAAMFHDSGYLKDKGDTDGYGGKFTYSHEQRSMKIAEKYLEDNGWPRQALKNVPKIISITEYHNDRNPKGMFCSDPEETMSKIVATSDLISQMADVNYMQRINDLYDEMKEAYDHESTEALAKRGIQIFTSAQEMIDETMGFYENFVLPRLHRFGRMDKYLVGFFGGGRNPYLESIAANLSRQLMDNRSQWKRLGEILQNLGAVNPEQLDEALKIQEEHQGHRNKNKSRLQLQEKLLLWMNDKQYRGKCLGDILMEMGIISSSTLREGLINQIMPESLMAKFSAREITFILHITILLLNTGKGPWVFKQILEMTNELVECEASSILLSDDDDSEMLVAIPTGPKKEYLLRKKIPTDKGLAGWVYRHGQPAVVSNVEIDARFDDQIDRKSGFKTRSILAVPLHTNGHMIGVMEVVNKKAEKFTVHDMDILTILANIIAVSLGGLLIILDHYTPNATTK